MTCTVSTETTITYWRFRQNFVGTYLIDDFEVVDVDLEAQATDSFSPVDLTSGSYTKVMLWFDMEDCKPLADAINY